MLLNFAIGGLTVDIISIVFMVIALLFILEGMKNGLVKRIKGPIVFIGGVVFAIIIVKFFTSVVYNLEFVQKYITKANELIANKYPDAATLEYTEENLVMALEAVKVPKFLISHFTSLAATVTEATTIGDVLARILVMTVVEIVLFIVALIVGCLLIKAILGGLIGAVNLKDSPIDKFLGLIYGAVVAVLVIGILCYVIGLYVPLNLPGSEWISTTMGLGNDEVKTLSKWVYDQNIVGKIISWIQELLGVSL